MYIASYGEVLLKSEPVRRKMVKILIENLRKKGITEKIVDDRGKLIIYEKRNIDNLLEKTPGIRKFYKVWKFKDYQELIEIIKEFVKNKKTFAVRVTRGVKTGKTSIELEKEIGKLILEEIPNLKVNLKNPEITVFVEIRKYGKFVYFEKKDGIGGLPIGSEGSAVSLFSGGTDSTLSSIFSMKRGIKIYLLFGNMGRFWSNKAYQRLEKSYRYLKFFDPEIEIYEFNLWEIHKIAKIPDKLRCLFCKGTMYKAAEILCKEKGCDVVITGESIGQVASQTLNNLKYLSKIVDIPILRPLVGLNKEEILEFSKKLGFYEITSMDVGRCLLKPRFPETRIKEDEFKLLKSEIERIKDYITIKKL